MSRWTPEQAAQHEAKHPVSGAVIKVNTKIQEPSKEICESTKADNSDKGFVISFTVYGSLMGKPRMTQRDVWKKRPCVVRYREYCDRMRAAAAMVGGVKENADNIEVVAHIPVSASWSKKKKSEMIGKPHRLKPDYDNICKSVGDALFDEDSTIWRGVCTKYWCAEGDGKTEIRVLYFT